MIVFENFYNTPIDNYGNKLTRSELNDHLKDILDKIFHNCGANLKRPLVVKGLLGSCNIEDVDKLFDIILHIKGAHDKEFLLNTDNWYPELVQELNKIGAKISTDEIPLNALFHKGKDLEKAFNLEAVYLLAARNLEQSIYPLSFHLELERKGCLYHLIKNNIITLEGQRKSINFIGDDADFYKQAYMSAVQNY